MDQSWPMVIFVSSSHQDVDPGDSLNHKHLITNTTISFKQSSLLSVLLFVQFYLFIYLIILGRKISALLPQLIFKGQGGVPLLATCQLGLF